MIYTHKVVLVGLIIPILACADLESVVASVGNNAITAATKIALSKRSKIILNNVELDCTFVANKSLLIGNGCNQLKADDIKVFNARFKAKIKLTDSAVIGNTGNYVGK